MQATLLHTGKALKNTTLQKAVAFLKTKGQPTVTDVEPTADGSLDADALLRLAAAAESDSEHPLAKAIVVPTAVATSARSQIAGALPSMLPRS